MSVTPIHQRKGIGSRLINAGLKLLEAGGANGCVLLGESDFSSRFGFVARQGLSLADFQRNIFWRDRSRPTAKKAKFSITTLSQHSLVLF